MQKNSQQNRAKIFQKIPLKNKLLTKAVINEKSELMVTRFGFEDTMAACGYSDGYLRIFNLSTDNKISQITTNPGSKEIKENTPINCLRWRPQIQSTTMSSVILVANTNGNLYQFSAKTGKQLFHTVEQDNFILAMDYTNDGSNFATAGKDNIVRIYDEETKKIAQELKGITWHNTGHNNRLFSLKFKNDEPDLIVSGGWDMNVKVWDRRTGNVTTTLYGPKIAGDGIDIRDNYILTASNRGTQQLQLWDWRENKVVHNFRWDQDANRSHTFLYCAQFCKSSPQTIVACGGSQMKVFSSEDFSEVIQVKFEESQSLYTCDSSHTSNRFLVGGRNGSMFYLGSNKTFD